MTANSHSTVEEQRLQEQLESVLVDVSISESANFRQRLLEAARRYCMRREEEDKPGRIVCDNTNFSNEEQ
jgi:hypothetical protein